MHVSPVCVSHPKQSSVTVRSGAPEAAEPALTHVSTHEGIYVQKYRCTQGTKDRKKH